MTHYQVGWHWVIKFRRPTVFGLFCLNTCHAIVACYGKTVEKNSGIAQRIRDILQLKHNSDMKEILF